MIKLLENIQTVKGLNDIMAWLPPQKLYYVNNRYVKQGYLSFEALKAQEGVEV